MAVHQLSQSVQLDGAGSGRVIINADRAWVDMIVLSISVSIDQGDEGEARVYIGDRIDDQNLIEGTYSGARDTSVWPDGHLTLMSGQQMLISWVGGAPGARATAVVRYRVQGR